MSRVSNSISHLSDSDIEPKTPVNRVNDMDELLEMSSEDGLGPTEHTSKRAFSRKAKYHPTQPVPFKGFNARNGPFAASASNTDDMSLPLTTPTPSIPAADFEKGLTRVRDDATDAIMESEQTPEDIDNDSISSTSFVILSQAVLGNVSPNYFDIFKAEKVLAERRKHGQKQYLIRWKPLVVPYKNVDKKHQLAFAGIGWHPYLKIVPTLSCNRKVFWRLSWQSDINESLLRDWRRTKRERRRGEGKDA